MTSKTLTGHYASAYHLQAPITALTIASTGYVAGNASYGIYTGAAATGRYDVVNHGTVLSAGTAISLANGGSVTNGTPGNGSPLIEGQAGVVIFGVGTVKNFATIEGGDNSHSVAVALESGSVTNGSGSDVTAQLYGYEAGVSLSLPGSVTNFGTIRASTAGSINHAGIVLAGGGLLTNGSSTDRVALISAKTGVLAETPLAGPAATVVNFGTIEGAKAGIQLGYGGIVVNGSVSDTTAEILGGVFVGLYKTPGTVTNFGTIDGVELSGGASRLIIEGGSTLLDGANGGGGVLEWASGAGTISTIDGEGNVLASSSSFADFATLEIGKGARFTLTGAGTVTSGGVTTLDVEGALDVSGSLSAADAVIGAGALALQGGETDFASGSSLTVAKVTVSGPATVVSVAGPLAYAGLWTQTGGTSAGTGALTLTGAGDSFANTTLGLATTTIDAASAKISGTMHLTGLLAVICPDLVISGSGTLSGGGVVELSNVSTNTFVGSSAVSLLTNAGCTIEGAGKIGAGSMRLSNGAGGIIDGDATAGLAIDTGIYAVVNAGLIEGTASGCLTIAGAVNNTGTLAAAGGNLTVDGAVTGAGVVRISTGSTAAFASTFSESVIFIASGQLSLASSQTYKATISGFSQTGATSLDLKDIGFASATVSYSGTTASGVLTVTDGSHTAHIKLGGDYTGSTFTLASDGGGGTVVTGPSAASPSVHALTAAMAGFAPATAASAGSSSASVLAAPLLASPGS